MGIYLIVGSQEICSQVVAYKSRSVKIMRETKQKQSLHVPVLSCRLM